MLAKHYTADVSQRYVNVGVKGILTKLSQWLKRDEFWITIFHTTIFPTIDVHYTSTKSGRTNV